MGDCNDCCPDKKGGSDSTPVRSSSGTTLPTTNGTTTQTVMIAGGQVADSEGNYKAIPLKVDGQGRQEVVNVYPPGLTTSFQVGSFTYAWLNGILVSKTSLGS